MCIFFDEIYFNLCCLRNACIQCFRNGLLENRSQLRFAICLYDFWKSRFCFPDQALIVSDSPVCPVSWLRWLTQMSTRTGCTAEILTTRRINMLPGCKNDVSLFKYLFYFSNWCYYGFDMACIVMHLLKEIRKAIEKCGVWNCIDIKICRKDNEPGKPRPVHCSIFLHFNNADEATQLYVNFEISFCIYRYLFSYLLYLRVYGYCFRYLLYLRCHFRIFFSLLEHAYMR